MSDTMSLSSTDSDNDGSPPQSDEIDNQKDKLWSSGSAALLSGSPREAVDKFKSALDLISGTPLKKISPVELILRYALCIAWIKTKDYRDIVRAVESLSQLIECGHAGKLPALYFGLAMAYFSLNRFKAALGPIEKALKSIQRISNLKQYFWPGINQAIEETSKDSLKKSLVALQKDCGAYRPPDATCRYEKCLNINQDHILPSENIYFSDPDFKPFISLNCEAKCKIAFHDSCWKHLKHERPDLDKYKDFLGQFCPTENCVTSDGAGNSARSIIVEIKLFGREGFEKPQKSWLLSENLRKHSSGSMKKLSKTEPAADKNSHTREKSVSESNGHTDKINQKTSEESRSKAAHEDGLKARESPTIVGKENPEHFKRTDPQKRSSPSVSECSSSSQIISSSIHPNVQPMPSFHGAHGLPYQNCPVSNIRSSFYGSPTSAYVKPPGLQHHVHAVRAVSTIPVARVAGQPISYQYHQFHGSYTHQIPPPLKVITPWPSPGYYQQAAQPWPQFYGSHPAHPHFVASHPPRPQFFPPQASPGIAASSIMPVGVTSSSAPPKSLSLGSTSYSSPNAQPSQPFPEHPYVEVVVQKTSVIPAGSTLLIPIGPSGGPVKIVPVGSTNPTLQNTTGSSNSVSLVSEPNASPAEVVSCGSSLVETRVSVKEVVQEFKEIVFKLAGEDCLPLKTEDSSTEFHNNCSETHSLQTTQDHTETQEQSQTLNCSSLKEFLFSAASEDFSLRGSLNSNGVVQDCSEELCVKDLSTYEDTSCSPISSPSRLDRSDTFRHSSFELGASPLTESSALQAKVKHTRPKEKKPCPETQASLMSPGKHTAPKLEQEPSAEEKLASRVQRLRRARKIHFGYSNDNYVNPELPYFGQNNFKDSKFVEPGIINKEDETSAEFVFSFYQSIFDNNGPHKIEDLEERWKDDYKELQLPQSFYDNNKSISKFLLLSPRFAAIDDIIGTSELLPDMFCKAEVELTESASFLLFSKVQKPRCKGDRITPDFTFEQSKPEQMKSAVFSDRTRLSSTSSSPSSPDADDVDTSVSEELDGPQKLDTSSEHLDDNENPIDSQTLSPERTKVVIKSGLRATSEPFIPALNNNTLKEDVYMSEDDEVLDGNFVEIENDDSDICQRNETFTEIKYESLHPGSVDETPVVPPACWSDGDDCSRMNATNLRNTLSRHAQHVEEDNISYIPAQESKDLLTKNDLLKKEISEMNAELESVNEEKEQLVKALSEAADENSELLNEIESVKAKLKLDADSAKFVQKAKETVEQTLKLKERELKQLEKKIAVSEASANECKKLNENLEAQVNKHNVQIEKILKDHAKEINYLSKKLNDEKLTMEKKVNDIEKEVKVQEQINLRLWKELCDFKTRTFFQTSHSRISILNQLKDKMSDSVSPTQAEISSSIKELENLMIIVGNKEKELKETYSKEYERHEKGLRVQLPLVINVPDIQTVPYPLDAALNLLERRNQSEPAPSRNAYSHQLFNNTLSASSAQMQSQSHDNVRDMENFPFRSRPPNETYQLWSHSFSSQGIPSLMHLTGQQALPSRAVYPSMLSQAPASAGTPFPNISMSQSPLTPSNISLPGSTSPTVMNGAAANSYQNILGSKQLSFNPMQKPHLSTPQASVLNKPASVAPMTSAGAVPKLPPRQTQTSPASMTPIVSSKGTSRKGKTNYERLMASLQKVFPTRSEVELNQALKLAREKNNNTLSSLSHSEIVARVEDILDKLLKKQAFLGLERFGQAAWGAANKSTAVEWDGGDQDACVICQEPMSIGVVETLQCKHAFHKECIREWFQRDRVCPNCRTPSTMQDEFPPLG